MSLKNRTLAISAVVALTITVSILFWLRGRLSEDLEEAVRSAAATIDPPAVLGDPLEARADFSAAESLVAAAQSSSMIRDIVLTKRLESGPEGEDEFPIVPYDLLAISAHAGTDWHARMKGWRKVPLSSGDRIFGYLYFDLDRSALRSANVAVAAALIALVVSIWLLISRVALQESTITEVGGELAERKNELIRIERLALAGQLSAGLLHDLKKPVHQIQHSVKDLEEALGDLAGASAGLRLIREQSELFFQLLNETQLERFVRSDRVQEEYVDVKAAIGASLRLVQYERRGVQVEEKYAENLPPVLVRPFRLVQVLSNIILNAYQSMRGKGTLRIEADSLDAGVVIRISDSGPGISPSDMARVFAPFFTTKSDSEGSGLGLSICKMIVEELGGGIEVESKLGGPTVFTVRIPAEPKQMQ